MEIQDYGDRLSKAMKIKGLSAYKLSSLIDVQQSTISNYKNNKSRPNKIVSDKIASILEVNPTWLDSGKGKFEAGDEVISHDVKDESELSANKNGNVFETSSGKIKIHVKKVPVKAFGSYLSDYQDSDFYENLDDVEFTVSHHAKGNYICFEVKGDSMNGGKIDDSKDGAELLCRELGRQHWKDGFRDSHLGWVIVHKDTIVFKDIKSVDMETGDMVLSSRSGLPQHPEFTVSLNDVRQIWKVIKRTQD